MLDYFGRISGDRRHHNFGSRFFFFQEQKQMNTNPNILTIREVSELTGISVGSIRRYIGKPDTNGFPMPFSERGKKLLWHRHEIEEWMNRPRGERLK
ncbi:helix-turn-helix transcriptional regulator [Escherichia coli]|uniref:helix-turn-helix transcriptional regulator n=1 Tax=Escherichia coli TaxID=562 RepID=UPI0011E7B85A|nr:helix-turn-helix domain-containing protein [Escherichia coli]EEV2838148.1 helix-turn-helix domain-containing protein [Escherichia coli O43:H2]EKH5964110.1 helix-turn-helix domain-containing protein [Escherichia coli O43]EEV4523988.1 helix-turn-helix domain-containing protein [Escherichia coli]EFC2237944.1 helix-turn-helix domain-containing protein [Escherichia coli]EFJ3988304.1 helix-turn-helix domain-containing protein [Escherichia coli]